MTFLTLHIGCIYVFVFVYVQLCACLCMGMCVYLHAYVCATHHRLILNHTISLHDAKCRCPAHKTATITKYQSRARVPMTSSCLCATGSTQLALLARSTALICSLNRPLTPTRAHGEKVFVHILKASISCSFNPLWAACLSE